MQKVRVGGSHQFGRDIDLFVWMIGNNQAPKCFEHMWFSNCWIWRILKTISSVGYQTRLNVFISWFQDGKIQIFIRNRQNLQRFVCSHFKSSNHSLDKHLFNSLTYFLLWMQNVEYAHTNWFCVVKENIKPEVLKVQTKLARSLH